MIRVQSLAKSFGKVRAVRDVSLHAPNGSITALLGNNGSGKSTTMRAITGLIKPDHGTIHIDDIDVSTDKTAARRRVGFFPDRFGLYPRLTGREHIRYFAEIHGVEPEERRQTTRELATQLDMEDLLDRKTQGFSTGQSIKIALARALVHRPTNLILDEPTRGLDVKSIRLLREMLRDQAARGTAILLSSHVMGEVEALAEHIVVIANGRTVAEGNVESLKEATGMATLEEAFVYLSERADREEVAA